MNDRPTAGDRVTWQTINACPGGIVEAVRGSEALVRLPSGKVIVTDLRVLRRDEETQEQDMDQVDA